MTFVTRLSFQSGDRTALEDVVGELKTYLQRKGVECKGPHASPPRRVRVPLYRTLGPGERFDGWEYDVYSRALEIHGSEHIAREIGHREFPDGVHVEIEVDQKQPLGGR